MSTLLLRISGPLQSWGVSSKYENRRGTERLPSKSGIIGLLAAALGRRRDESVKDLSELAFGVRTDREGSLLHDFHMARHPYEEKKTYVTHRYYLSDALFLVGLEGPEDLLARLDAALAMPAFPLFFGRRSCPPEGRLSLGIRTGKTLLQALSEEPWLVSEREQKRRRSTTVSLRIQTDATEEDEGAFYQRDVPVSFDQSFRSHGFRRVKEQAPIQIENPFGVAAPEQPETTHDPLAELSEE
jgi:CRISPR system Cascade subunit CasD